MVRRGARGRMVEIGQLEFGCACLAALGQMDCVLYVSSLHVLAKQAESAH